MDSMYLLRSPGMKWQPEEDAPTSSPANSFPWTESWNCTTIRHLTSLKTFPSWCNGDQDFAARNSADFEAEAERSS